MYAVIASGGKQEKVAQGDRVDVELLGVEDGADVTFTPAISGTAVSLARLIAQGRQLPDLAGLPVPSQMLIDSELVTRDNVDQFTKFGWD